jgi:hypothetical protein
MNIDKWNRYKAVDARLSANKTCISLIKGEVLSALFYLNSCGAPWNNMYFFEVKVLNANRITPRLVTEFHHQNI